MKRQVQILGTMALSGCMAWSVVAEDPLDLPGEEDIQPLVEQSVIEANPLQALMDWMQILKQRGVDVDYEQARRAALDAWIKSADSKAKVWTDEMDEELAERRAAEEVSIAQAEIWPGQLAYIKLHGLFPGAGRAVVDQIEAWSSESLSGLMLDIRGANGEDLSSARAIAGLFLEEGAMLFAFRDRYDQDIEVYSSPTSSPVVYPVMILVDHATGGAAEVLAAALRGIGSGVMLVGKPTSGDLLLREIVVLDEETRLRVYLATRRLVASDGTEYTGEAGVQPNALVTATDWQPSEVKPSRRHAGRELRVEEKLQLELNTYAQGDATVRRALDILLALKALHAHPLREGK